MSYEVLYNKILNVQNEMFACVNLLHRYTNGSQEQYAELENRLINARVVTEREIVIDETVPEIEDVISYMRYVKKHLLKSIETNYSTLINMMHYFKSINVIPNDPDHVPIVKTSVITDKKSSDEPTDIRYETPANDVILQNQRGPTVEESFRSLVNVSTQRSLDDFVLYNELSQLVNQRISSLDEDGLTRMQAAAIVAKALMKPAETNFQLKVPPNPTPQFVRKLDAILFYLYQICRAMRYNATGEFLQQKMFIRRPKQIESSLQLNLPVTTPRLVGDVQNHLNDRKVLLVCQISSPSIENHFERNTNTTEENTFTDYPELWTLVQYERVPPLAANEALLITNVVRFNSSTTINEYTAVPVDTENAKSIDVGFVNTFNSLQDTEVKFEALMNGWKSGNFGANSNSNDQPRVLIDLNDESLNTLRQKIMIFTLVATSNMLTPIVGLIEPDRVLLAQEVIEQMRNVTNRQLYHIM
jgi:hypothetical protein